MRRRAAVRPPFLTEWLGCIETCCRDGSGCSATGARNQRGATSRVTPFRDVPAGRAVHAAIRVSPGGAIRETVDRDPKSEGIGSFCHGLIDPVVVKLGDGREREWGRATGDRPPERLRRAKPSPGRPLLANYPSRGKGATPALVEQLHSSLGEEVRSLGN